MNKILAAVLLFLSMSLPAHAGRFLHAQGAKPIKGRYIVLLKDSVAVDQIESVSRGLGRQHNGRLVAIMKDGLHGFGVELPEGRARALAQHPLVAQVEEDEEIQLASSLGEFDFAATLNRRGPERVKSDWNNCPWAGSYYLCTFADDTYWHLDRIDNSGLMYSYKAYGYVSTGANVRAYVVDTGVWYDHQEFGQSPRQVGVDTGNPSTTEAANMMVDSDLADSPRPGEEPLVNLDWTPADYPCGGYQYSNASHGTAVASVLAGKYTGVAKDAKIIPVKVFGCNGQSSKLAMARGLDWVRQDVARHSAQRAVVSMSIFAFTTGPSSAELCEDADENAPLVNCISAMESAVSQLVAANVPVVVSANNQNNGNCATSPARMGYGNEAAFPTAYRTITVGGTMALPSAGYTDQRWNCAQTPGGCTGYDTSPTGSSGSNYGACVSIYAPAYNIHVAGYNGPTSYRPLGSESSGTSYSAPIVAGIIARLLSTPQYSTYTPYQLWIEVRNRAIGRNVQPADFDPSTVTNTRLAYLSALQ